MDGKQEESLIKPALRWAFPFRGRDWQRNGDKLKEIKEKTRESESRLLKAKIWQVSRPEERGK